MDGGGGGARAPGPGDPGRPSGSACRGPAGARGGREGLPLVRPPAVTVKKLQKWMYKGRLLSLGMRGRSRGAPPKVAAAQAASPNLGPLGMRERPVLSVPADPGVTLTGRTLCRVLVTL